MAYCVRCRELDPESTTEGNNLFKGRFLCFPHFKEVMDRLSQIAEGREAREEKSLPEDEPIPIQAPRIIHDEFGRVSRVRGQHFTISKKDLRKI